METQEIWIERMTSPQVKEAIKQGYSTVLVAVGSNEQHGPHLPTGTDSLIGDMLVDEAARRVGKVLVAPTIRVGASEHHMAYPGTITLREEVLEEIIVDYCRSLSRHGFKTILVIPTHGGNIETVARTAKRLQRESLSANAVSLSDESSYLSAVVEVSAKLGITPGEAGTHAGHMETSIVLAVHPDIVDMDKATRGLVDMGYDTSDKLHEMGMHQLSPIGILGDATNSTAEAGKDYIEFMASAMAERVTKIRAELEG
jgi:creatinine amidohydrolase